MHVFAPPRVRRCRWIEIWRKNLWVDEPQSSSSQNQNKQTIWDFWVLDTCVTFEIRIVLTIGLFVRNSFWSPIIVCCSMRTLFQCRLSVPAKAWQRVGSQVLRFCTIVPDTGQDDQRNKLSKLQQTELYELEGSKIVINTGENFSKTFILNFVLTRPLAHASFYGCELICIGLKFTLKNQSLIPKGRG